VTIPMLVEPLKNSTLLIEPLASVAVALRVNALPSTRLSEVASETVGATLLCGARVASSK
jgi:hypothetical protein